MKPDSTTRIVMLGVAALFAALALLMLSSEAVSEGALVVVIVSYVFWYLAFRMPRQSGHDTRTAKRDIGYVPLLGVASDTQGHTLERYYFRLMGNIEINWQHFQQDHRRTEIAIHNVLQSLEKAMTIARSTELLAGNAMLSAATCGEVGRGFVSVSRDLIGISEQSLQDLQRLRQLLRGLGLELTHFQGIAEPPLDFWLVSSAGMPVSELVKLRTEVTRCQQELQVLSEHYGRAPKQDVRWLQLRDAVKRLLNELINTLFQLELHIQDVLSDMRLLKLAEGTATREQIVEIKDRFQATRDAGGLPQKFMS